MNLSQDSAISPDAVPSGNKRRSGFSPIWIIPIVTALIGGWLIVKTLSEKGPQITITFKTAEGIEAGKTKIKYKDIEIGTVDSIHFNRDFSHVIVTANMEKDSDQFLRRETLFWVVKPRLSLRGATGLGTLLSGAYIEIEPGHGAPQRRFTGLDAPPVVKASVAGIKIMLLTKTLGSIDTGSPVYYRGIVAGEILGWELGNDRKSILIHAFIRAPYDELVQSNTRFWNVSGVDLSLGSQGVHVKTESLQSILYGGIAFETPDTLEPATSTIDGLIFTLYDDPESIKAESFTQKISFVLFFDGSVRGLNVGAPVEFKGIKVGSVLDVRLEFDNRDSSFRIPVLIEIEPERVIERGKGDVASPFKTLETLVDRGLRAQLRSGSFITGQLYVDLDMHPGSPIRLVNSGGTIPELPTIPASMEQMTASVKTILARLEKMEFDNISTQLLETIRNANLLMADASGLISKPEVMDAINDLKSSLEAFKSMVRKVDRRVEPVASNLEDAIIEGRRALEKVGDTLGLMDKVLNPDSPLQFRLIQLTEELAETARSIRNFVDMMERNPNAIIFGKTPPGKNR